VATANFLEAIKQGARQVEVTINGIGERAGNTALEELVMALHVRRSYFNPFLGRPAESTAPLTRIDTTQIYKTSRLVSSLTGMVVQPNKAIVGANAFAHESGIHQDGVLKHRQTYEIMDARTIGWQANQIVLGKHSGRHAFRARLQELGFDLHEQELNRAFLRFKELADKKKEITDRDLEAIASDEMQTPLVVNFRLERVQVSCGDHEIPTATVTVRLPSGEERTDAATGTGPVDAVYKAINRVVPVPNRLVEFSVQSVTAGIDAIGEVTIRLEHNQRTYSGHAANTDIIVASAQAYMNALNRLYNVLHHHHPGRVLIQTMHNARTLFVRHPQKMRAMGEQGIHQGTVPMTGRRMHHQPRRFVENQYIVIFIENVQSDGLGGRVQRLRVGNVQMHPIPRAQGVIFVRLHLLVDLHTALLDQLLQATAGKFRTLLYQPLIQAGHGVNHLKCPHFHRHP